MLVNISHSATFSLSDTLRNMAAEASVVEIILTHQCGGRTGPSPLL